MTSAHLIPDLQLDEGFRAEAYPDPLSGAEPWTVGFGSTSADIHKGTVWTRERALMVLEERIGSLTAELADKLPWWADLADLRQDVLVNMAYQLGLHGLLGFTTALARIGSGDYAGGALAMLESKWAKQTPGRAHRLALQMETGEHA